MAKNEPKTEEPLRIRGGVELYIPKKDKNDNELYVAVNGVRGMLQKGKTIYVSEAIAEVVRNSMTQEEKAEAFIRQNAK